MADTTAQAIDDFDAVTSLILDQAPQEEEETEADAEEQAEDQDASDEEASDEADEGYEDEEDAEEAVEEPAPTLYTVKVDGQEKQVTLEELRRGYSGQEFIQQQMRTIAENRKQVEAAYHQLQQEAQQVATLRQRLETNGLPAQPKPPSREMLNSDPIGYMEAKAQYEEDLASWQQQTQELEALNARQQQMQEEARRYVVAQEMQKLQQAIPEFADKERAVQLRDQILRTGQEAYGFNADELQQLADSRAVRVLYDAMRYRQMVAARGEAQKRVETSRPVVKPGSKKSVTAGKVQKQQKVAARMRQTGSVDDVAKFLLS